MATKSVILTSIQTNLPGLSANSQKTRTASRYRGSQSVMLRRSSRSFRFGTIKKSPRLNRSSSQFARITTAALASPRTFMAKEQLDDVTERLTSGDRNNDVVGSSSEILDAVNAVLADIVDGQKYIKETGRTMPRPMKRRALIVCLALGTFQPPVISEIESKTGNLRQSSSSSFARTRHLISQISFGASKLVNLVADNTETSESL